MEVVRRLSTPCKNTRTRLGARCRLSLSSKDQLRDKNSRHRQLKNPSLATRVLWCPGCVGNSGNIPIHVMTNAPPWHSLVSFGAEIEIYGVEHSRDRGFCCQTTRILRRRPTSPDASYSDASMRRLMWHIPQFVAFLTRFAGHAGSRYNHQTQQTNQRDKP